MKLLYATDLDRTLIYSHRFIDTHETKSEYTLVEKKGDTEISYMSNKVRSKLHDINRNKHVTVVPVTTRSKEEYERVNLGVKTRFAIIDSGGTILEYGKPMEDWEEYIKENVNMKELAGCAMELNIAESTNRDSKLIDGKYVFTKTDRPEIFDTEAEEIAARYPTIDITRVGSKVYAIPKSFNKAIALRWLQLRLGSDKLLASGDSLLDLPMLAIANYAIVPNHGELVQCRYVTEGRIIDGGIDSPLKTFDLIENILNGDIT